MIGAKVVDIVYMIRYGNTNVVSLILVLLRKVVEVLPERFAIALRGASAMEIGLL